VEAKRPVWMVAENLVVTGIRTRTVHPPATRYSDYPTFAIVRTTVYTKTVVLLSFWVFILVCYSILPHSTIFIILKRSTSFLVFCRFPQLIFLQKKQLDYTKADKSTSISYRNPVACLRSFRCPLLRFHCIVLFCKSPQESANISRLA
jgi:hypothetical protein